jgi:hypothetical protein
MHAHAIRAARTIPIIDDSVLTGTWLSLPHSLCLFFIRAQGWEARQDRTGRLYFVDHVRKCTSWEDPRPLPPGWECKADEVSDDAYTRLQADRLTNASSAPVPPMALLTLCLLVAVSVNVCRVR